MNASRAAVMVVGVNLFAVWAAAAAGGRAAHPRNAPESPAVAAARAVGDAQVSLAAATERLDVHARRAVSAAVVRNPFRFGGNLDRAGRANGGERATAKPVEAPTGVAAPADQEPDLVLSGMAESREGETVVRTAILRAGGNLVLATLGARVDGRYEVVSLGSDSVELEDLVSHERRTCRMK